MSDEHMTPVPDETEWLPSAEPAPPEWPGHPKKKMRMTPRLILLGGIFAFLVPTIVAAFLQTFAFEPPVSDNWSPLTEQAIRGRQIYLANGCVYCHSGYTRPQDVRYGLYYLYSRVSLPGDFATSDEAPNVFGTARIGPDLSQEGGYHPDDWHLTHFVSARMTTPFSLMPRFEFLSDKEIEDLTAYVQLRAGKAGLVRYSGQLFMKDLTQASAGFPDPPTKSEADKLELRDIALIFNMGVKTKGVDPGAPPDGTIDGLAWDEFVNLNIVDRSYWLADNPLPVTSENLQRGRVIFQERCIGCHGTGGAAVSEAARYLRPTPADFTSADDAENGSDASPGDFYYRVLRGIHGTAMENFGTRLRVDDIWRVVLFLKCIPNGGLSSTEVPTADMYVQWKPGAGIMEYVSKHPLDENVDFTTPHPTDPFLLEAQRVLAGMRPGETFNLPGYGELSLETAAADIEKRYRDMLDTGWTDYQARDGKPVPPQEQRDALPEMTQELR